MASYAVAIANAVRTVVAALSGAPSLVEVRKTDVAYARDVPSPSTFAAVLITVGDDRPIGGQFGGGTDATLGPIQKTYEIGISIYGANFGNIASNLDQHPAFVLLCKQALNKTSLAGVSTVYDTELFEHPTWERQAFGDGNEVSRFGILFYNTEPRNG